MALPDLPHKRGWRGKRSVPPGGERQVQMRGGCAFSYMESTLSAQSVGAESYGTESPCLKYPSLEEKVAWVLHTVYHRSALPASDLRNSIRLRRSENLGKRVAIRGWIWYNHKYSHGSIAQLVRALRSHRRGRGFESPCFYQAEPGCKLRSGLFSFICICGPRLRA